MNAILTEYTEFRGANKTIKPLSIPDRVVVLEGYPADIEHRLLAGITETYKLPDLMKAAPNGLASINHGVVVGREGIEQYGKDVLNGWRLDSQLQLKVSRFGGEYSTQLEIVRSFFREATPWFFKKGKLADTFYRFSDACETLDVNHVLVAGACTYYYWGGWPLWDIDTVMNSIQALNKLARLNHKQVDCTESDIGKMKYVDFGEVDALADLTLSYREDSKKVDTDFSYQELTADARCIRLFGQECQITSAEMTVLMKLYLGRFGLDKWNVPKDDYEDGLGVLVSQDVSLDAIIKRAQRLGIVERIETGIEIAEKVFRLKV